MACQFYVVLCCCCAYRFAPIECLESSAVWIRSHVGCAQLQQKPDHCDLLDILIDAYSGASPSQLPSLTAGRTTHGRCLC